MTRINKMMMIMAGMVLTAGCSGKPATGLGDYGLKPCPGSPNCVSSAAGDQKHSIAPLAYAGSREQAVARLKTALESAGTARLVAETPEYLHAEFRSRVFRFVDDVEFWFPEGEGIVHVRSASRLGYSDFGVNRKRVEALRRIFDGAGE